MKLKEEMKMLSLNRFKPIEGMDIQSMKIAFMEEFLKVKDESIIKKLTATLQREKRKSKRSSIDKFAGVLSDDDAKVFLEASQECRKIDMNEW